MANIALIVADKSVPSTTDVELRSILEADSHAVTYVDAADTTATIQAFAAAVVSPMGGTTASSFGAKLKTSPMPIVILFHVVGAVNDTTFSISSNCLNGSNSIWEVHPDVAGDPMLAGQSGEFSVWSSTSASIRSASGTPVNRVVLTTERNDVNRATNFYLLPDSGLTDGTTTHGYRGAMGTTPLNILSYNTPIFNSLLYAQVNKALEYVTVGNALPVVDAGPDATANVGTAFTLNGASASDPGGSIVSTVWSIQSAPAGSTTSISNNTSLTTASLTADLEGPYLIRLTAIDDSAEQSFDERTITAYIAQAPNGVATVQYVALVDLTSFEPSVEGDLTYSLDYVSGPVVAPNEISIGKFIIPLPATEAVYEWTVNETGGGSSTGQVTIAPTGVENFAQVHLKLVYSGGDLLKPDGSVFNA